MILFMFIHTITFNTIDSCVDIKPLKDFDIDKVIEKQNNLFVNLTTTQLTKATICFYKWLIITEEDFDDDIEELGD